MNEELKRIYRFFFNVKRQNVLQKVEKSLALKVCKSRIKVLSSLCNWKKEIPASMQCNPHKSVVDNYAEDVCIFCEVVWLIFKM